jgi:hypothetical protein
VFLFYDCYMPQHSYPPWFNHSNILWGVKINRDYHYAIFLTFISRHSIRSKRFPKHAVFKHTCCSCRKGRDYVSQLQPLLFISQTIYECGYSWWNDIGRGKLKNSGKYLSQCHFVHQKSHMDWPGREHVLHAQRPVLFTFPLTRDQKKNAQNSRYYDIHNCV